MNQISMGMLTPNEAQLLVKAAQGAPLFQPEPETLSDGSNDSQRLGYFLIDTLANQEIFWNAAYQEPAYDGGRQCFILVVNLLTVPIKLGDIANYSGEQWVQPGGQDMQPMTGALIPSTTDTVPPVDKDGHPGFAVWGFVNAEPNGSVNAGLAFTPDPNSFPDGMSLGVLLWNQSFVSISLLPSNDSTSAQNNAWNSTAPGTRQISTVNSSVINGTSVAIEIDASIQMLDPYETSLIVVAVSNPADLPLF